MNEHADDDRPHDPADQPDDPAIDLDEERMDDESRIEVTRVLANESRERLRAAGFHDAEIDEFAEQYLIEHGSGDVASFVRWVQARAAN